MKIGIIGPSRLEYLDDVNKDYRKIIEGLAKVVAEGKHSIVVCADKGSASEFFANEYIRHKGKKVYEIIPKDDKEFGYSWLNQGLGETINCGTWRNQPEKLNEETDVLLCIGYAVGVMAEIAYSKWFKPKPIYIINELVSNVLPSEVNRSLQLIYLSANDIRKELKG